MLFAQWRSCIS